MAKETYSVDCIVLRKTKLGESDLILTLLAQDGSQISAVAKGARKPSNTFAARLELYSVASVLCAKGKTLDIIKEARLLDSNDKLRCDLDHASGAAPMVELLDKVTQAGLESPRLFALTRAAFACLQRSDAPLVPSITAAHLLKALAFVGFKPSFNECVSCGCPIDLEMAGERIDLSFREGGAVCDDCSKRVETIEVQTEICKWACVLLASTFDEVAGYSMDAESALVVLQFCRSWVREHVGVNLKSLDFMFANELYSR